PGRRRSPPSQKSFRISPRQRRDQPVKRDGEPAMAGPQAAAPSRVGNQPATARQVHWPVTHPPGWLSSPHACPCLQPDQGLPSPPPQLDCACPASKDNVPALGSALKQTTKRRRVSPLLFSLDERELN